MFLDGADTRRWRASHSRSDSECHDCPQLPSAPKTTQPSPPLFLEVAARVRRHLSVQNERQHTTISLGLSHQRVGTPR